MKNVDQKYNNYYLINTSEFNKLIFSIKDSKYIVKIDNAINYDIVFESFSMGSQFSIIMQEIINQIEKYIIINILEHARWNKSEAARILKINYKTLYYKMKKYSI